ncbi:MAG: hypothetical protein KDD70_12385 [Bdellovibrionales bacterium]|nr:hypothetical protein [Bdellovibrionales bacterium]
MKKFLLSIFAVAGLISMTTQSVHAQGSAVSDKTPSLHAVVRCGDGEEKVIKVPIEEIIKYYNENGGDLLDLIKMIIIIRACGMDGSAEIELIL